MYTETAAMHNRSSIINRRADRGRSDTCNESHKLISERVDPFTSRHFTFVLRAPVQSPAPRLPATNSIQSLHPTPLDTTHSASSGCATIPPHLKQQQFMEFLRRRMEAQSLLLRPKGERLFRTARSGIDIFFHGIHPCRLD